MHFILTQDLSAGAHLHPAGPPQIICPGFSKPLCSLVFSGLFRTGLQSVGCLHWDSVLPVTLGITFSLSAALATIFLLTGWLSFIVSFVLPERV